MGAFEGCPLKVSFPQASLQSSGAQCGTGRFDLFVELGFGASFFGVLGQFRVCLFRLPAPSGFLSQALLLGQPSHPRCLMLPKP